MRFEVKTDKETFSYSFYLKVLIIISSITLFFLLKLSFQLGKISKYQEINYLCNLFLIEKSSFNFNKLSKLTNETSKQKIWDLCKEIHN